MNKTETYENILKPARDVVILNLTNVLGFSSGYVNPFISKNFPKAFKEYRELCGWYKDKKHQDELIGLFQGLQLKDGMVLCNAFAQRYITETKFENDPDAWRRIIKKARAQIEAEMKRSGKTLITVRVPYKVSYGMLKAEQELFRNILEEELQNSSIDIQYCI